MDNLIKDLMKLDLAKFSKNRCNSGFRRGSASPNIGSTQNNQNENGNSGRLNSSSNQNLFNQRHNSQQQPTPMS